jgi:hypothetical protein
LFPRALLVGLTVLLLIESERIELCQLSKTRWYGALGSENPPKDPLPPAKPVVGPAEEGEHPLSEAAAAWGGAEYI